MCQVQASDFWMYIQDPNAAKALLSQLPGFTLKDTPTIGRLFEINRDLLLFNEGPGFAGFLFAIL
jgi:hypothetical protein